MMNTFTFASVEFQLQRVLNSVLYLKKNQEDRFTVLTG